MIASSAAAVNSHLSSPGLSQEDPPCLWLEPAPSADEFTTRMNKVLRLFEGNSSMHNFHRRKEAKTPSRRLKGAKMQPWVTGGGPSVGGEEKGGAGEGEGSVVGMGVDGEIGNLEEDNDTEGEEEEEGGGPFSDGDINESADHVTSSLCAEGRHGAAQDSVRGDRYRRFFEDWKPVLVPQVCKGLTAEQPPEEAFISRPQSLNIYLCEATLNAPQQVCKQ